VRHRAQGGCVFEEEPDLGVKGVRTISGEGGEVKKGKFWRSQRLHMENKEYAWVASPRARGERLGEEGEWLVFSGKLVGGAKLDVWVLFGRA